MLAFFRAHSWKVTKFLVSGGSAAAVNLSVLYVCTEYLHFWYVASAIVAFVVSFVVSFTLQKFWTFSDRSTDIVNHQVALYLFGAAVNLTLGTLLLFLLVEITGLHYLAAQIIVQGLIACASFFIYSRVIFTGSSRPQRIIEYVLDRLSIIQIPPAHLVVMLVCVALLSFVPLLYGSYKAGVSPLSVPFEAYTTGNYYYDRMHEIVDGHPFMGNPYFKEHRGSFPPAFFVADWLAVVPLLLGASWIATIHFDFIFWSFIFLLLAYRILRELDLSERSSLVGALLAFMQVYVFMVPAVSMQVVFPTFLVFLLTFVRFLREPGDARRQLFLSVAAAVASYAYTYAAQIILVAIALTGLYGYFFDRAHVRAHVRMILFFGAFFIPFVIYSLVQIQQPFYFETMTRIGLVYTHIPLLLSFKVALWPLLVAGIFVMLYGIASFEWRRPAVIFFAITGIAILGVMYSNIITGTDLELAQHLERFVVLWLILVALYLIVAEKAVRDALNSRRSPIVAVLLIGLVLGNFHYFDRYGLSYALESIPLEMMTPAQVQDVHEFEAPLTWLRDNVPEESVIWADPEGKFNSYITLQTHHYVLFNETAVLQLMSNEELEERYLVSHYFALTREQLLNNYRDYAGTGNAEHAYKNHNKNVKICEIIYGRECGDIETRESFKGKQYFDGLFYRYKHDIQKDIVPYLKKYGVAYIVHDSQGDTTGFSPEEIKGTTEVYSDQRFTIYKLTYK